MMEKAETIIHNVSIILEIYYMSHFEFYRKGITLEMAEYLRLRKYKQKKNHFVCIYTRKNTLKRNIVRCYLYKYKNKCQFDCFNFLSDNITLTPRNERGRSL